MTDSVLNSQYQSVYDLNASLTQIRMFAVGPDAWPIVPAPLAFIVAALLGRDCSLTCHLDEFYLTYNTKCRELLKPEIIKNPRIFIITVNSDARLLIA